MERIIWGSNKSWKIVTKTLGPVFLNPRKLSRLVDRVEDNFFFKIFYIISFFLVELGLYFFLFS